MSVGVPSQSSQRLQQLGVVVDNVPLCRDHYRLVLRLDAFPPTRPGQFVQLACRDLANDAEDIVLDWEEGRPPVFQGADLIGARAFLRRPFSLAGRRDGRGTVELDVIHRVVGVGTDWLSRLKPRDTVDVLGPLGNVFTPPAENGIALFVGGGVGIPPMLYLASDFAGRRGVAFAGALTRDLLPLTITADAPEPRIDAIDPLYNIHEFAAHGFPAIITTDDGSYGFRGYVTDALQRYLDRWLTDPADRARVVIYTCGPEVMMKRVASLALERGIACQVAVERAMACGMGTCQSCCIRVRKPEPDRPPLPGSDWCYRLACTDGPVFPAKDLLW